MKRFMAVWALIVALVLGVVQIALAEAPQGEFTAPRANTLVTVRDTIPVAGSVANYASDRAAKWHFWVSLATVNGQKNLVNHWPKFYIQNSPFKGMVYEGGFNPLPTPQPVVLLILKVDEDVNQRFTQWLRDGPSKGYPGFRIDPRQIVGQQPIRLP
jgi:hypothetical protein